MDTHTRICIYMHALFFFFKSAFLSTDVFSLWSWSESFCTGLSL